MVGRAGRRVLRELLPGLREELAPDFVVVNGENAARRASASRPRRPTRSSALGADAITLGNHTYRHREIWPYLEEERRIVRPYNYLPTQPGRGTTIVERDGVTLGVVNLSGMVHLQAAAPPLVAVDAALSEVPAPTMILVDMHAEVTSEKVALGWYLDGKVTAVVGTHTHVPTADVRVLPGGTAYITDVGMTGARGGVIGMKKEQSIAVMRTHMPMRYEPSEVDPWLNGVLIRASARRADSIEQILRPVACRAWTSESDCPPRSAAPRESNCWSGPGGPRRAAFRASGRSTRSSTATTSRWWRWPRPPRRRSTSSSPPRSACADPRQRHDPGQAGGVGQRARPGRLVLGVAVGGREDDFRSPARSSSRGKAFDRMLGECERDLGRRGDRAGRGTAVADHRRLLGAAFGRSAEHDGWIMGGGSPDQFREGLAKLEEAWQAAGRDGKPRTMALSYYALGDGAKAAADGYLNDYYGFLGEVSQMVADSEAKDAETVRAYVAGFEGRRLRRADLLPLRPGPGPGRPAGRGAGLDAEVLETIGVMSRSAHCSRERLLRPGAATRSATALESLACSDPCEPPPTWCAPPQSRNS